MGAQMAADSGLRRLFEKPLPENPTLLEALSAWNHRIHPKRPVDPASFTEIFGELHFQEKPEHRSVSPPPPPAPPRAASPWADAAEADKSKDDSSLDALLRPKPAGTVKRSASFCSMRKSSASSLLLCTEGLGSESTVDADDMLKDGDAAAALSSGRSKDGTETDGGEAGEESAAKAGEEEEEEDEERKKPQPHHQPQPPPPSSFPPPIRSIGRVGRKPSVCFRSFRADGRFVLMEVVIPGKELLQAYREGGRLRLQFADGKIGVDGKELLHGEEDKDDDEEDEAKKPPPMDDQDNKR